MASVAKRDRMTGVPGTLRHRATGSPAVSSPVRSRLDCRRDSNYRVICDFVYLAFMWQPYKLWCYAFATCLRYCRFELVLFRICIGTGSSFAFRAAQIVVARTSLASCRSAAAQAYAVPVVAVFLWRDAAG